MSEHRIDQSDGNDDRTRAGVEDAMTVSCPRRSPETVSDRLGPEQGSVGAQEVAEEEASKDVRQGEHVDVNLRGSETLPEAESHDDEAVNANRVGACGAAAPQGMGGPEDPRGRLDVEDVEDLLKPVVDDGGVPAGRREVLIRQRPVEIGLRVAAFGSPTLLQRHEKIGRIEKPILRADDRGSLIASDGFGALVNRHGSRRKRNVGLAHEHASVSTSKPGELRSEAGARTKGVEAISGEAELEEAKGDGGRERRAHGSCQSGFALYLGETTTSESKKMTHGRSREAKIDVSLIDGAEIGLKR